MLGVGQRWRLCGLARFLDGCDSDVANGDGRVVALVGGFAMELGVLLVASIDGLIVLVELLIIVVVFLRLFPPGPVVDIVVHED